MADGHLSDEELVREAENRRMVVRVIDDRLIVDDPRESIESDDPDAELPVGWEELRRELLDRSAEVVPYLSGQWLDVVALNPDGERDGIDPGLSDRIRDLWNEVTNYGLVGADDILGARPECLPAVKRNWREYIEADREPEAGNSLLEPAWLRTKRVARWLDRVVKSAWFDEMPETLRERSRALDVDGTYWLLDNLGPRPETLDAFVQLYKDIERWRRGPGPRPERP